MAGRGRWDMWSRPERAGAGGRFRSSDLSGERHDDCPCCGQRRFEFLERRPAGGTTSLCGRDAVQISPPKLTNLDLSRLADKLKNLGAVKQNEYLLRLTVGEFELTVFRDARAIIRGTDDVTQARSVYAKYIGV